MHCTHTLMAKIDSSGWRTCAGLRSSQRRHPHCTVRPHCQKLCQLHARDACQGKASARTCRCSRRPGPTRHTPRCHRPQSQPLPASPPFQRSRTQSGMLGLVGSPVSVQSCLTPGCTAGRASSCAGPAQLRLSAPHRCTIVRSRELLHLLSVQSKQRACRPSPLA